MFSDPLPVTQLVPFLSLPLAVLFCIGLSEAAAIGGPLNVVVRWMPTPLGTLVYGCTPCMSWLWGIAFAALSFGISLAALPLHVVYVFCLVGLNYIVDELRTS